MKEILLNWTRVTSATWRCGFIAILLVAGCTSAAPVTEPPTSPSPSAESPTAPASVPPMSADIEPVSATKPTAEAADAMAKCHIGDQILIELVSGMGLVPSARELERYVPLTGREPQLKERGPAWVIQIRGDVLQRGGEVWTNPTCVVTASDSGYFATGPVKNPTTRKVSTPEPPASPPDRTLPPLAP